MVVVVCGCGRSSCGNGCGSGGCGCGGECGCGGDCGVVIGVEVVVSFEWWWVWSGDGYKCGYCGNGSVGLVEAAVVGVVWCGGDSCVVVVEVTY